MMRKPNYLFLFLLFGFALFLNSCNGGNGNDAIPQVLLTATASPSAYGSVTPSGAVLYDQNTQVTLTATANDGYLFSHWSGDLTGSQNPVTIVMNTAKTITANFIGAPLSITITSPFGAPDPPVGTTTRPNNSSVTLSCGITPYPVSATTVRYVNTGWTGGSGNIPSAGSATSVTFVITQNCAITWTWRAQYRLQTAVLPTFPADGGIVVVSPTGPWYDADAIVDLEAIAGDGFQFASWSGDLTGTNNPYTVTMNSAKSIVANFSILNPRSISVTSPYGEPTPPIGQTYCPDGYPVVVSCGQTPYLAGGTRYISTGWTGGSGDIPATGSDPSYSIPGLSQDSAITWTWRTEYRLTTAVSPSPGGSIIITPYTDGWYEPAASVTLQAVANTYYNWVGWSGDLTGSENPKEITMNASKNITANFLGVDRTVTVASSQGVPNPPVGTTIYPYGNSVTVSCGTTTIPTGPGAQYACTGWTGGSGDIPATSTQTSYQFTITQNSTITWLWQTEYRLVAAVSPADSGVITPPTGWYAAGATLSLNATTNAGYRWVGWSGDLTGTANPQDLTMNSPKTVTANFTPDTYDVTVASPYGVPKPSVGRTSYIGGSLVTVSCGETPYAGPEGTRYICTGWVGGTGNIPTIGSTTSCIFTINVNSTITWSWKTQYLLTLVINPSEGGSVTVTPAASGNWYDADTQVALQATPATGYGWSGWSGDLTGAQSPANLTINSPKNVTANFIKPVLTVSNPAGCGTPRPGVGTNLYNYNDTITAYVISPVFATTRFTEGFEAGSLSGWTTGSPSWRVATAVRHSGSYSAQAASIGNSASTYIEREFTIGPGGGSITFWWKVSSELNRDYLEFYIDGELQSGRISGEVDWTQVTLSLAAGLKTLRWRYVKDASGTSGSDSAWIDDITVAVGPFVEGFEAGSISGWSTTTSPSVAAWRTTTPGYVGIYSARSGVVSNNQSSYIERTFPIEAGGGSVSFWWKVSSEANYDYLEFYIDGQLQPGRISGVRDWAQLSFPLSEGRRTLRWRYTKDVSNAFGDDCGWIDEIIVTPAPDDTSIRYTCTGYTGTGSVQNGTGSIVTFAITQNSSITWNWRIDYRLTTSVAPTQSGTVYVDFYPPSVDGYYTSGSLLALFANANIGYVFNNWSGDLTGSNNPCYLTMDSPKNVTANFAGPNLPSNLTAVALSPTSIRWSWTSSSTDWQEIAAGVLRTLYDTLTSFATTYSDIPPTESCPRTGSGSARTLFEASDDLLDMPGTQDCPTVDASSANTYTITYTRLSPTAWTCTADTTFSSLNDYFIDESGILREQISTGDGPQANASSSAASQNVWFEIQNSAHTTLATVYPNITSWQETGLSENTIYTRHVHGVTYGVYTTPSNDASRYTFVHDATTSDFVPSLSSPSANRTIGTGTTPVRYPIDIAYNYARSQMLYLVAEAGTAGLITKIRFQRDSGDADTVNNVTIHMAQTTAVTLTSWQDTTSHTLVFSGNLSVPSDSAGTWFPILLTTPFSYNGTSNLIISVRHQDGSGELAYTLWRVDNTKINRCVAGASNTVNPPSVETASIYLPNLQLEIGATVAISVTPPPNSTTGSTGVRIERDTSSAFTAPIVVQDYAATYSRTDSLGSGLWYYRIIFRNAEGIPSAYSSANSINVP